jgi:pimeloyl-ACP methyl ester carboxylesterase
MFASVRVIATTTVAFGLLVAGAAPRVEAQTAPTSFQVEVTGRGRPMILIPGLASSGDTWDTTVAHYRDRYECHVLTLAGFAGSSPIDEPLMATVRRELVAYIEAAKLDRPVIVGHSLGGTLALAIGVDRPDLVGPLVIVDGLPFLGGAALQASTAEEARQRMRGMLIGMRSQTDAQWNAYMASGATVTSLATRPEDLETIKQWGMASDRRTMTDVMAEAYTLDLREDLDRVTAPTLALGASLGYREQAAAAGMTFDPAVTVGVFRDQFARLRPLHFALSDKAHHFIMLDEPTWMFEEMDRFLADPQAAVARRGLE